MPGRFFLKTELSKVAKALGVADFPDNEPPRVNIAPGQEIVVCTPKMRLTRMRWGMIPVGRVNARGRPVMETIINARSESLFDKSAFQGVGRAIVPADGWYEWTGKARRKQAWRIRPRDEELLFFAAITDVWQAPGGRQLPQVATVTCAPNADVRDIHHRMGVLLRSADVATWLLGDGGAASAVAVPYEDGLLMVEPADDVDWTAP